MEELRIIIAGSRSFQDYQRLRKETLNIIKKVIKEKFNITKIEKEICTIVSGHASGADKLGEQFAKEYGLPLKIMPANWEENGKKAGYLRNAEMANFATDDNACAILIAFWDGTSKGTKHMIDIAKKKQIDVYIIYEEMER